MAMKKMSFNVQKWVVRVVVAIGALLGISACVHTKRVVVDDNNNNINNYNNYNNNNSNNTPQIHALKYGPLVQNHYDNLVTIIKRIDENGNVVYDTIAGPETPKPKLKPIVPEDE